MTTITKPTKHHARKIIELLSHGLVRGLGKQEPGAMCVEAAVCCALGLPHGDNPPCVAQGVRAFKIALNDSSWSSNQARAAGLRRLAIAQLGSNEIDETIFAKELALATVRQVLPMALRAVKLEKEAVACEGASDLSAAWSAARSAESATWSATESAARSAAESATWSAESAARSATWSAWSAAWSAARSAESATWSATWSAARSAAESATWSAESAAESATWSATRSAAESAARSATWSAWSAARSAARDQVLSVTAEAAVQALIKAKSPGCKWLDLAQ